MIQINSPDPDGAFFSNTELKQSFYPSASLLLFEFAWYYLSNMKIRKYI